MKIKHTLIISMLSLIFGADAMAQRESDFYHETIGEAKKINVTQDFGVIPNDRKDDSRELQRAINHAAGLAKGGRIYFPKGTYRLKFIKMLSNVHLVFHKDAIIKLPENDREFGSVFDFGRDASSNIKNVSVRGEGGKFTIDLRGAKPSELVMCFRLVNVFNFKIENVHIIDNTTIFSQANFQGAKNGVLKNMSAEKTMYGYGLVQAGNADNIFFKNLKCEGGVTLRIEVDDSLKGANNIVGRNITGINGNAAVMLSPHSSTGKNIDIRDITSIGCSFGVRLGRGFGQLGRGHYTNVKIYNVKAVYGDKAQVRTSHLKYLPCELKRFVSEQIKVNNQPYHIGPSIAPVLYDQGSGDGYWDVDFGRNPIQMPGGFIQDGPVMNPSDLSNEYKERKCRTTKAATLYKGCNYSGKGIEVYERDYTQEQLKNIGIPNDDVSSLKVNPGYEAVAYQHNNFGGFKASFTGNTKCMLSVSQGRSGNSKWNDDISSLKVRKRNRSRADISAFGQANRNGTGLTGAPSVYPNPFSSEVNIDLPEGQVFNAIQLLDMTGKVLFSKNIIEASPNRFPTDKLKSGFYLIRLSGEDGHYSMPIFKK